MLDLGTWGQQVAEFPHARPGQPWHGYPLWPLREAAPPNRRKQMFRPAKEVYQRLVEAALITDTERGRLEKGEFL